MRILLDAMGGDNAPKATIEGALEYAKDTSTISNIKNLITSMK